MAHKVTVIKEKAETNDQNHVKKANTFYRMVSVMVVCIMIGTAFGVMISADTPTGFPTVVEPGGMVTAHDLVVFQSGSTYFIKNCTTGGIEYSNTNATTLLQYAINNAAHSVLVKQGTYVLHQQAAYCLRILRNGTIFKLESGAILRLADSEITGAESGSIIEIGDGANIISNITVYGPGMLDGNRATNDGAGTLLYTTGIHILAPAQFISIRELQLSDCSGDAIYFYGVGGPKVIRADVTDCRITGCGEGILFVESEYVQIRGNHISDVYKQDGIEPAGGAFNWTIEDNLISNIEQAGLEIYGGASYGVADSNVISHVGLSADGGIGVSYGCKAIIVSNNILTDVVGNGIGMGGTPIVTDVQIIGNYVSGSTGAGVKCTGDNWSVQGNVLNNTGTYGISAYSGTGAIIGNSIKGSISDGISVTNLVENVLVSSNVIKDAGEDGIQCSANSGLLVSNLINSTTMHGVYVITGKVWVLSNTIRYAGANGIDHNGNNATIEMNVVTDSTASGIRTTNGANLSIRGNFVCNIDAANLQDTGIYLINAKDCYVEQNTILRNTVAQILISGGSNLFVRYNQGYRTESSGYATITGAVSTVTVNHGLVATPTIVLITGNDTRIGNSTITTISASQFIISFENQPGTLEWKFYWYAQTW